MNEAVNAKALIGLIAEGDLEALGELYDRLGSLAYGLALRVARDPGLAEDAVEGAFLSVWRSASSFDVSRGDPRSWLAMLVYRRAAQLAGASMVDAAQLEEPRRAQEAAVALPS